LLRPGGGRAACFASIGERLGSTGHRMISKLAIENLPADTPAFLRTLGVSDDIGELGREPDRIRGAGKSQDADDDRGHFLDLDDDGMALGVSIDPLPDNREDFDTALRGQGQDQYKSGFPALSNRRWMAAPAEGFRILARRHGRRAAGRLAGDRAWLAQDRATP